MEVIKHNRGATETTKKLRRGSTTDLTLRQQTQSVGCKWKLIALSVDVGGNVDMISNCACNFTFTQVCLLVRDSAFASRMYMSVNNEHYTSSTSHRGAVTFEDLLAFTQQSSEDIYTLGK